MFDRLATIEDYMATNDEYIVEAARQAAEAVMEAYRHAGPTSAVNTDMDAIAGLAGDLRALEELTRASEDKPDLVIDFATLTGAARVALGPDLPALFTRRDETADALIATEQAIQLDELINWVAAQARVAAEPER